ncbi:transglycosylase domain-containing protein [Rhodocytophaga aerolata]|uniref:Transglycosylase domain-containing protein n=1 Tax=Rhodocytophaga aerolata TaxID=455078 RepID=A0ABT8R4P7_9BACT|nr:transglycosylase domain-containing protein [Rhodocytophaga aerolata]MDO1445615.1 transglycosylase domain-containing protein [Rhodocytophaga aerolata]
MQNTAAKDIFEKTTYFLKTRWQAYRRWRKARGPETMVSLLWKAFGISVALVIFFFVGVNKNLFNLFGETPSLDKLQNPRIEMASELYTADGKLIGKYYRENRSPVPYNKIAPVMVKALIATEDIRFYDHSGIDPKGVVAAFADALAGDGRGASTITQQLAKNLYKTREKDSEGLLYKVPGLRTLVIKTKEWITAIKLERTYSKEEILTLYLNTVDYGSNAFGIKTAARTFFNTTPDSLAIQDAAVLVGGLKATTYYSPLLHPDRALKRRNVVLSQMAKYNFIKPSEYDSLSKLPIKLDYTVESYQDGTVAYYGNTITNYLNEWCKSRGYDLYTDGFRIYTTIDSRFQQHAEVALEERMRALQNSFDQHWRGKNPWVDENDREIPGFIEMVSKRTSYYRMLQARYKNHPDSVDIAMNKPKKMRIFTWAGEKDTTLSPIDSIRHYKKFLHAGMMTMDPFTGHIKAWVGGINFKHFQYDHVKQGRRQPGSTFKPFVYVAAIDNGFAPCDRITDYRVTINYVENGEKKSWTPRNADWVYSGRNMTLRHALGRSINTVTAQLTEKVGKETVVEYAHKLGITSPIAPVPSVGLGSSDVSVYEMVGAYSTFVNGGTWMEPIFIARIEDRFGNIVHQFSPRQNRAISQETAWLMIHMLKGGIEEPGGTAQNLWSYDIWGKGNQFATKTGTTSNFSDGWFMGLTKDLVTGVWVGGDDRSIHFRTSALGEGSKTAMPVYGKFMERIYKDADLKVTKGPFPKPPVKITKRYYCPTILPKVEEADTLASDAPANEIISVADTTNSQ